MDRAANLENQGHVFNDNELDHALARVRVNWFLGDLVLQAPRWILPMLGLVSNTLNSIIIIIIILMLGSTYISV